MASVIVEKISKSPPEKAFSQVRELLENDSMLRGLDSKYVCSFDESCLKGSVKGRRFEADVHVTQNAAGAKVVIEVKLSFLLSPFKQKVKDVLQGKLDSHL